MITNHQIQLVQQSWELVKPLGDGAGILFYGKLFDKAPAIRHLFNEDITVQSRKLMSMLAYVVGRLDRVHTIVEDVQKLGARHNQYGAQPQHYEVVGECLLETLAEGLGKNWNDGLRQAWLAAFTLLKNVMIEAQQQHLCA